MENTEVLSLKLGKSHYVYLQNKWLIVYTYPSSQRLISFRPDLQTE